MRQALNGQEGITMPNESEIILFTNLKDAQKEINRLKHENKMLQNSCHVLTHGTMCIFCPYECENREGKFRGEKDAR